MRNLPTALRSRPRLHLRNKVEHSGKTLRSMFGTLSLGPIFMFERSAQFPASAPHSDNWQTLTTTFENGESASEAILPNRDNGPAHISRRLLGFGPKTCSHFALTTTTVNHIFQKGQEDSDLKRALVWLIHLSLLRAWPGGRITKACKYHERTLPHPTQLTVYY